MYHTTTISRRNFLRAGTLAGATLAAGTTLQGCREKLHTPPATSSQGVRRVERPLLVSLAPHTSTVLQQPPVAPVAFFDRALGIIYVDRAFQEAVRTLLKATVDGGGRWIIQGGDGEKIAAQVAGIPEWDPTKDPPIGSFRIVNRSCFTIQVTFNCIPVLNSNPRRWLKCQPISYGQCIGPRQRLCREDYIVVGTCNAFSDPACTIPAGQDQILDWFCLEE